MEFTMRKIISIDRDAENYKKNMEQLISNKRKDLETEINNIKAEAEQNLNLRKKEIYTMEIEKAESTVKRINKESGEVIKKIQYIFESEKYKIIDETFKDIINSCKEV